MLLISTSWIPSVNRIELHDLTLAGPTITRLVQDSLNVAFLDNQLYMLTVSPVFHTEVKDSIGLKTYLRM